MKKHASMSKGIFYIIVLLCAVIIMVTSIETIIKAKDIDLFNLWLSDIGEKMDTANQSREALYSTYLTMCISTFFMRIITPVGLAINSYLSFIKLGINKLFVSIWSVLIIGLFLLTVIGQSLSSLFFIISSICYIALIFVMINLWRGLDSK